MNSRRNIAWVGLVVIFIFACFVVAAARIAPRVRALAGLNEKLNLQLAAQKHQIGETHFDPSAAPSAKNRADDAARNGRAIREWILLHDLASTDDTDGARDAWLDEMENRTGRSREAFKKLLPRDSADGEPSTDSGRARRFSTFRDLTVSAANAGIREFEYVVISGEPARDANARRAERFGNRVDSREIKMEYACAYRAHGAFIKELLRRRERGPFYTLDSMTVGAADVQTILFLQREEDSKLNPSEYVRVTLQLRRIVAGEP
ncbi:MAG: hypothetical protein HY286_13245 [Planctomycetes bacterium]|nr:hypothetical protein [Planctomycetota bacterium]